MEPLRPFFDLWHMDILAFLCFALGLFTAVQNFRFMFNGFPLGLRQYIAVKGVVALLVSGMYFFTLINAIDPAPPPLLTRSLMLVMIAFMATDTWVRRDEEDQKKSLMAESQKFQQFVEEDGLQSFLPQSDTQNKKEAK